jgi:hypothetical protein
MRLVYSVYGLRVLADAPVPGLLPAADFGQIDVRVWLNRMPSWWESGLGETAEVWYRSPGRDENGNSNLTIWKLPQGEWFRILYYDGTEFLVDPQRGQIWSQWLPNATVEDSATYLIGPVFGFVLRMRGVCCLHASAVNVGQTAIAFVGRPQAGKSSTAAAFAKLGYPVISDDIAALVQEDSTFLVQPGYPRLCLWPDVTASLYGSSLPRITPLDGSSEWWDKRYLDLTAGARQFQAHALPLSAIYLLDERLEDAACPRVEAVPVGPALVQLAANTYMNYLLDRSMRSTEFHFLSRVVSGLPVRRVIPHTDPAGLTRLCETILEDHARLPDRFGARQEPQVH